MNRNEYLLMNTVESKHWWFFGKKSFISQIAKNLFKQPQLFLDIGCGTGGTTSHLTKFGKVVGLEQSKLAGSIAKKKRIKVVPGSANLLPFPSSTFSVVSFFDVLYHKEVHEEKALSEAARVLKPHGYLLITDCAHPSLWSTHDVAMHAKKRFEKRELESLVKRSGFSIVRSSYIFFFTFPFFALDRLLSKFRTKKDQVALPHPILNLILTKLIALEAVIFNYVNLPIGSSIIIVAQKI